MEGVAEPGEGNVENQLPQNIQDDLHLSDDFPFNLPDELGQTPAEVLRSTTLSAAELMGLQDELGSLEPGKRADLVVVEGDAFDLKTLPERIEAVYRDGASVLEGGA